MTDGERSAQDDSLIDYFEIAAHSTTLRVNSGARNDKGEILRFTAGDNGKRGGWRLRDDGLTAELAEKISGGGRFDR